MNNLWNPVDGSTAIIISYGNELAAQTPKEAIWGRFMIGPSTQNLSYKLCLLIDIADNSLLSTSLYLRKKGFLRSA